MFSHEKSFKYQKTTYKIILLKILYNIESKPFFFLDYSKVWDYM